MKEVTIMTIEQIRKMASKTGCANVWAQGADDYVLTIDDFGGFDDDWDEMENEDCDGDAVDHLLEEMEEHCQSIEGNDFHDIYVFDGFTVEVAYTSEDD